MRLNPNSAQAHLDLATVTYATLDWISAEESYSRALELREYPAVYHNYANMMMRSGRSSWSLELHKEADSLRRIPAAGSPLGGMLRANSHIALKQPDEARQFIFRLHEEIQRHSNLTMALNFGSLQDVRNAMQEIPSGHPASAFLYKPIFELLDSPAEAIAYMQELVDDEGRAWPFKYENIALFAAFLGYPEVALDVFSREMRYTTIRFGTMWYPVMAEVRKLPEFKQLVIDVNLVEYWREYRWSDFCRPISETDFVCE